MRIQVHISGILVGLLLGCAISPQNARTRGDAFYDLGQYPQALPLLERAFAGGMEDPELAVRLAYCRASVKGDVTGAITLLRDNALQHPGYARTFYELGYIAFNYGPKDSSANLRQAIDFTLHAAKLDSLDWKSRDNLGMYYGLMGVLDSSRFWLREAQKMKPDSPELNERLAQLEQFLEAKARQDSAAKGDTLELSLYRQHSPNYHVEEMSGRAESPPAKFESVRHCAIT